MRKEWLKVNRGLITDPKHRIAMGETLWLYLYMLDCVNWNTGKIEQWIDSDVAESMSIPVRTLRYQREKLESAGYISCSKSKYFQTITINKYRSPVAPKSGNPTTFKSGNPAHKNTSESGNKSGNLLPQEWQSIATSSLYSDINQITDSKLKNLLTDRIEKHRLIDKLFIDEFKFKKSKPSFVNEEWIDPIAEMLGLTDFDTDETIRLIKKAMEKIDKGGLSVSTPKGLVKTFKSEQSREERLTQKNVDKEFRAEEYLRK